MRSKSIIVILIFIFFICSNLYALSGREIIEKSLESNPQPKSGKVRIKMIVHTGGTTLNREFVTLSKRDGAYGVKSITKFIKPSRLKILHTREGKLYQTWIRLTSGKIKRLSTFEMARPLFNSHFCYQDMYEAGTGIDDYKFKYIGANSVLGSDCYMVEAVLKNDNSLYSKRVVYIRKSDFIGMRTDFYINNLFHKYIVNHKMKNIQGFMTSVKAVMTMAENKNEKTVLITKSGKYNIRIKNSQFSKESLR